ncbi:endoribonuclease MazF [Methylocystis rosea]|uniref:Endoribonuclease MazF n=1 Tax=Methylocystis rosea TaxID=173366 RepID=A0A3G8M2P9_9HYPH|nr:endoribonuclease MazF [Methylocystis rosea]AZG75585.1 endoribonuclease MazF [Methylocystis rosea]
MPYVPERGDIVWLSFDPQAGHEQKGHRPALVLSPKAYNGKTGLMLCCPMTMKIKAYPFEVPLAEAKPSVALADQVKSLDWRARKAKKKGAATKAEVAEALAKARTLLQ